MYEGSFGTSAPADDTRQQYRVALEKQLRTGLANNRQIDLRFVDHEVVVAFADEPISPIWRDFALARARDAHIFVAPPDFESGRLTMLSLAQGSIELAATDIFIDPSITFGTLVEKLRFKPVGSRRFNVIESPASIYHDGLVYSFTAGQCVDV